MRLCHIWNAVRIGLNFWHQILFWKNVLLLPNYIENNPPNRKFSKTKNKKAAITFGEECILHLCNGDNTRQLNWRTHNNVSTLNPFIIDA